MVRILLEGVIGLRILSPIFKPLARLIVSLLAIPVFRFFVRRVMRTEVISQELQKDLEQWFRGAVLLLIASPNMEDLLFGWISPAVRDRFEWLGVGLRILLAVGVIEGMPDQALFSIIHPGPPLSKIRRKHWYQDLKQHWREFVWGYLAKHLNRSSPVFAIMCVLFDGAVGWVCYGLAIAQYLLIGLIASRDAALDALTQLERAVDYYREEVKARVEEVEPESPGRSLDVPQAIPDTAGGDH
jgi:hypothetical protein